MGFSAVAAAAILLSAGVMSASGVFDSRMEAQEELERASEAAHLRDLRESATSMSVTNFQYNPGLDRVRVTVQNTGHVTLHAERLHVVLDGVWTPIDTHAVDGRASDLWTPGSSLLIEATFDPEPNNVVIVTEDGVRHFWRQ